MSSPQLRYLRAAYLRTVRRSRTGPFTPAKLTRIAMAGALLVLPVACSSGDESAFGTATTPGVAPTAQATEATASEPAAATVRSSASGAFPAGAELLVSFTYEPSSSTQSKRPYAAVWVEDGDGALVDTISLWFEQGRKGTKWLSDLSHWYQASSGEDTTMSGATRTAGEYTVAWDGTDADGQPVAAGRYVLNIESAREHGPTSFVTGTITVSDDGFAIALEDDGELGGARAVLNV